MIKNYFNTAIKIFYRQKLFTLINIIGLAIGIACSLLIFLWVLNELSYDKFHANSENIYIVGQKQFYEGGQSNSFLATPGLLSQVLKDEYPEITNTTRLGGQGELVISNGEEKKFFESNVFAVDPEYLELFSYPLTAGDGNTALDDPYSIILSEEMAIKYFGEKEPIGKILKINNNHNIRVTGVLEKMPKTSSLIFDFLIPFKLLEIMDNNGEHVNNWGYSWYLTIILVNDNVSIDVLNEKIREQLQTRSETTAELFLWSIEKMHLYEIEGGGTISRVIIFSIVAFLILLIACINFMNLTTAYSVIRSKEIGIRKVNGASKRQLVFQFIGESVFLAFIALNIALIIIEVLLPHFNQILEKNLSIDYSDPVILLIIIGITLFTGIIAGSYPSFYLSGFKPVTIFRDKTGQGTKASLIRKALVVIQFTIAVIFITSTVIVFKQLKEITNYNTGLKIDNVLYFHSRGVFHRYYNQIKEELIKNPNILSITRSDYKPNNITSGDGGWEWDGKNPEDNINVSASYADLDYLETFEMEMVDGRFFSRDFPTDSLRTVVFNEAAIEAMGIESPVGKSITHYGVRYNIIGVVKNFHHLPPIKSTNPSGPLALRFEPFATNKIFVKLKPENVDQTISNIKSLHDEYNPDYPFACLFLKDDANPVIKEMKPISRLILYFGILTIFISCMGLFGLTSYSIERRKKEIAIRKVLGASSENIISVILQDYIKLVSIAIIIGIPVAYFMQKRLLDYFVFRTKLPFWIFLLTGISILVIAFITVRWKTIKAANSNIIDSIKYE